MTVRGLNEELRTPMPRGTKRFASVVRVADTGIARTLGAAVEEASMKPPKLRWEDAGVARRHRSALQSAATPMGVTIILVMIAFSAGVTFGALWGASQKDREFN